MDNNEHHHHDHNEFDYERIGQMRAKLLDIEKVLTFLDIKKDEIIADVGSGDGYYSILFSKLCKKVYSIDHSENGISLESEKIKNENISNIEMLKNDVCSMREFPFVSRVFFSTSFHDFDCSKSLIERFSSKNHFPTFSLIEFHKDSQIGPPKEIKLSPEDLDSIFNPQGYTRTNIISFDQHYIVNYVHKHL
jgi:SAM-dependent methyltransferase